MDRNIVLTIKIREHGVVGEAEYDDGGLVRGFYEAFPLPPYPIIGPYATAAKRAGDKFAAMLKKEIEKVMPAWNQPGSLFE
jgi:hypothetical protein